jgi:hypothetical protein
MSMFRAKSIAASLLALTLLGGTPAMAQSNWQNRQWDRESFWRGAPSNLEQRVEFLQRRINRGVANRSLTAVEARNLTRRLNLIRRDLRRGRLTPARRDMLQARMDDLSRGIRWQRGDGDDAYGRRDAVRDDRRFATTYDAARHYRDDPRYTERRITYQDEVYRGSDGRYYCKRSDGTTGLIVGALGGGLLGNVIDGGRNRVGGTLIGGALGALVGTAIDQNSANNDLRCR